MKDFFEQELAIGDAVAFMEPNYRNMIIGKVLSFTHQSMVIEWKKNYIDKLQTFRATSAQVIKKPN